MQRMGLLGLPQLDVEMILILISLGWYSTAALVCLGEQQSSVTKQTIARVFLGNRPEIFERAIEIGEFWRSLKGIHSRDFYTFMIFSSNEKYTAEYLLAGTTLQNLLLIKLPDLLLNLSFRPWPYILAILHVYVFTKIILTGQIHPLTKVFLTVLKILRLSNNRPFLLVSACSKSSKLECHTGLQG